MIDFNFDVREAFFLISNSTIKVNIRNFTELFWKVNNEISLRIAFTIQFSYPLHTCPLQFSR